ncbi:MULTISPECIES: glycosyltransferase family 4 protein [Dyella]|uniref:Glycosyltransferase family 4 protein n=2 Tax=Dyella TaxID=231454 RepID=A0A4R0YZT2_9GAMM|nr:MULTISPECIES: glycosyltransferase family 4 protein [Dyella]TBR39455.1 glycosyltransferase family 4 protein [Dyella terrae]TCI12959.1 glycosyltransferase family 4 protein [Dyella soli]
MRIAQISPLYEAVPPKLYGGTERIVAYLTDALVARGHEVTLFAGADADTRARLVATRERSIRLDPSPLKSDLAAHLVLLHQVRERAHDFDVLHFHIDQLHLPVFEAYAERTLTTLHGRLDLTDLANAYACWPQYALASISRQQRSPLPRANWIATVPHGIPGDLYRPHIDGDKPYLAFLGRISPEKRPDRAIAIAKRAGMPLRMAAKVDAVDRAYFHEEIEPLLDDPLIEYIGEISDHEKEAFLGHARALLFPIDWPEPFGLVMIEAMACGTPVIAWNCGSVPGVVDHGLTGYIVANIDDAVTAISRLGHLSRERIRSVFERRFTANVMAAAYEDVYREVMRQSPGLRAVGM